MPGYFRWFLRNRISAQKLSCARIITGAISGWTMISVSVSMPFVKQDRLNTRLRSITQFMHRSHIITGMALIAVLGIGCLKSLGQSTNQQAHGELKQVWEPTIRVQFLSMTNDAAGAKLARFELHNFGKEQWKVYLPGFVDIGMRGGGYVTKTNAVLQAGASVKTSIPAPKDGNRWRAEFLCNPPGAGYGSSIYSEYLPPN